MKFIFTLLLVLISNLIFSQNIDIPDTVFLNKLLELGVDSNNDGIIQINEAQAITTLNVSSLQSTEKIENMEGIQYFTNLTELRCQSNLITTLDVTALTNLELLYCSSNQLNILNIDGLNQLSTLWATNNNLTSINLTGLDTIWWIWVSNNNLTEISLAGLGTLEAIWIANNQLSSIDFSATPNLINVDVSGNLLSEIEVNFLNELEYLDCHNNQIEEISISNLAILQTLYIGNNLIEEIDGSQNPNLIEIHCQSNPNLTYINMKNGAISTADPDMLYFGFSFYDTPELTFICMDEGEEYALSESGYDPNNVTVSTTDCTMSFSDVHLKNLTLYPNPVANEFHITNSEIISKFEILDFTGKSLFKTSLYEKVRKKIVNLKTGVYFLILNDKNNNLKSFRVIKK